MDKFNITISGKNIIVIPSKGDDSLLNVSIDGTFVGYITLDSLNDPLKTEMLTVGEVADLKAAIKLQYKK